ncbi:hypothetical protein DFH08DRAFT_990318 [Mycena albidolilacea]|uniref:Uncharacterized protein n=1 Tax=Mycena albidolilacea TaxID=1033008 RepID=A0AAD7A8M3_9AGAR|nr:hypothetical protein DFH08DRAFT_990318 [Mycena albidolilacea]
MSTLAGYPGWRCSFTSFLSNLSIMFSGCLFLLVVVQNISGQAMEKYYVAGAVLICLICNIPLYASGNLGHVLIPVETCWFNNPDKEARFRWVIGTQISWMFIFAVGEAGAFLIILGYLVTHEFYLLRRPAHTETAYSSEGAGSTILKFRNIILRIGLYPLVSCVLNLTVGVIDLHVATCAGRPLIYGLLAATDPSFIRALNALRHPEAESPMQSGGRSYCLSTIVNIPPDDTYSYDSESLHNDCAQQERMHAAQESSTSMALPIAVASMASGRCPAMPALPTPPTHDPAVPLPAPKRNSKFIECFPTSPASAPPSSAFSTDFVPSDAVVPKDQSEGSTAFDDDAPATATSISTSTSTPAAPAAPLQAPPTLDSDSDSAPEDVGTGTASSPSGKKNLKKPKLVQRLKEKLHVGHSREHS